MPIPPDLKGETNSCVHATSAPSLLGWQGAHVTSSSLSVLFRLESRICLWGALCPKDASIVPARAPTSPEDTSSGSSRRRQEGKAVRAGASREAEIASASESGGVWGGAWGVALDANSHSVRWTRDARCPATPPAITG